MSSTLRQRSESETFADISGFFSFVGECLERSLCGRVKVCAKSRKQVPVLYHESNAGLPLEEEEEEEETQNTIESNSTGETHADVVRGRG